MTGKRISDETRQKIINLWKEGVTSGEIALSLNITRSAVMGFVHRQKLSGMELRGRQLPKPKQPDPPKPPEPPEQTPEVRPDEMPVKPSPVIVSIFERRLPARFRRNLEIHELTPTSCRFIVTGENDPVLYCGDRIAKGSYCGMHADVCYVKPRRGYA